MSTEIFELLSGICDTADSFTNRFHPRIAGGMFKKHVRTVADLARLAVDLGSNVAAAATVGHSMALGIATALGTGSLDYISRRMKCSRWEEKESKVTVLSPPAPRN